MCAVHTVSAQTELLAFDHSRVVQAHYDSEMSTYNQIIYADGEEVVSDKINCVCEQSADGRLLVRLFKEFPTETGQIGRESHIVVTIKLNLVSDAHLYKFPGRASVMDKFSIPYLNVKISRFGTDDVAEIRSTMKFRLPAAFGYTDADTLVHFRFRCSPGSVTIFD
jgi:hypothetical protein